MNKKKRERKHRANKREIEIQKEKTRESCFLYFVVWIVLGLNVYI